jgi:hypothetical protein
LGNTALLVKVLVDGGAEKHWISTESLLDTAVEPSDRHCCSGLSGTTVLFNADAPKLKPISIQEKGSPARDLCKTCFGISPTFATDRYVVAVSWPGASFVVASPDGRLLYKQKIHDGPYSIEYSTAAADAPRVAVIYPQSLGRQSETYSVSVFDLATRSEVRRQSVGAPPEVSEAAPGFQVTTSTAPHIAISPDGKRLAILAEGQLSMYELP